MYRVSFNSLDILFIEIELLFLGGQDNHILKYEHGSKLHTFPSVCLYVFNSKNAYCSSKPIYTSEIKFCACVHNGNTMLGKKFKNISSPFYNGRNLKLYSLMFNPQTN